ERKQADGHDDRRQCEDRGLFGCPGDQVAGGRDERDSEADGEGSEAEREMKAAARQPTERYEPAERGDHAAAASRTRPRSRWTTRSNVVTSSRSCVTSTTV